MSRVGIKICGITTPRDAEMAAEAGADAIGLIFYPRSPRAVSAATAREIVAALPPFVCRVGVCVDLPRAELLRIAGEVPLDILQLHGQEAPEDVAHLSRRVIKALSVGSELDESRALAFEGLVDALLLDTAAGPLPGGSGIAFDWALARALRPKVRHLILAGGLNPANVAAAIRAVRPDAIDVSSGVERSPGVKDPAAVRDLVRAVREVEQEES